LIVESALVTDAPTNKRHMTAEIILLNSGRFQPPRPYVSLTAMKTASAEKMAQAHAEEMRPGLKQTRSATVSSL